MDKLFKFYFDVKNISDEKKLELESYFSSKEGATTKMLNDYLCIIYEEDLANITSLHSLVDEVALNVNLIVQHASAIGTDLVLELI